MLTWLGHASFKIKDKNTTIYIDPYQINETETANYILVTHSHQDHCSIEDIKKISNQDTTLLITADCQSKIPNYQGKVVLVEPNQNYQFENLKFETVPAYNTNKFRMENIPFHPKENDWVGYIINMNNKRIYHSGDTDNIPEMQNIQNVDVALVPIGGKFTMTATEAAQAIKTIMPKMAIPMHWGKIIGEKSDAQQFKEQLGGVCNVQILE